MAKALKATLLLLALALLAGIPAVASAKTENSGVTSRITAQQGPPSVSISAAANAQVRLNVPILVTATFSEPVFGFTIDEITVSNGAVSNFAGSDGVAVYTFDVTPDSLGEVTVDIAAGVATDGGGAGNTAAPRLSLGIPYDFDGNGGISKDEAIAAVVDYFAGSITKAQTIEVIVLYFSSPTELEPSPMVMQSLTPGEELMLEHPSGAMIEIPADATAGPEGEELMVSVEEVAAPEENVLPVGKVFDFSIVDQDGGDVHLREPVAITVPYTLPAGKDAADVALLHWDERLGRWEAVEAVVVDEATQTATAQVEELSNLSISWFLNPIEFIAIAALGAMGTAALQEDYDAGYKHLVSFTVDYGFRPPMIPVFEFGEVGGSLVLDIDDLMSLPLVQDFIEEGTLSAADLEPITVEGGESFVTFWLNFHAKAQVQASVPDSGLGFSIGISRIYTGRFEGNEYNRDPRFDASFTAMSVSFAAGPVQGTFLNLNANGNINPGDVQISTCVHCKPKLKPELRATVNFGGFSTNILKGELNTGVLGDAMRDSLKASRETCSKEEEGNTLPGKPGPGGGEISQEFVASEFICSILKSAGEGLETVATQTFWGFTEFEHMSPEQVAELDPSAFNRVANATGGHNVNGDDIPDMVFPSHDESGSRMRDIPLQILVAGDRTESKDFLLELRSVTPGWEIRLNRNASVWREDLNPAFEQAPIFASEALQRVEMDVPPLSLNATHWLVTAAPDAPERAVAEFRLVDDAPGFLAEIIDEEEIVLWKDKTLVDLSIVAEANPDPVATGETMIYTVGVANNGPDRADGVTLQGLHTLGQGLRLTGALVGGDPLSCDATSKFPGETCHLGPLDAGETVEATLEFELAARLTEGETVDMQFAAAPDLRSRAEGDDTPLEDQVPGNNATAIITGVRTPDREVLAAIYNAMGGASWNQQRNWLSGEPVEDWYGVSTDEFGRVTGLDLYYVGLSGPLPPEIGGLTYLEDLSIAQNVGLSGTLPPELGRLTSLRRIYITGSRLEGPIPAELASLTNLRELSLHNNRLSGQIPSWLADLTDLQHLYLAGNAFTGCVPEGLADVAGNDLASLGLEDCGLGNEGFASISAGLYHTCGLKRDGSVACWGANVDGQATPPAGEFDSVSAGGSTISRRYHTCGLKSDGSVACWGSNSLGQATPPAGEFTSINAGYEHNCGVKRDGSIACWGSNSAGQATPPAGEFTSVSAGWRHSCGLKRDGSVVCWGINWQGRATPPAEKFASISTFDAHNCGLKRDGSVACWGANVDGQATPPAGQFTSVSAGYAHSCGVRQDGSVVCWGYNPDGQATPPAGKFVSVSAGGHTCGVKPGRLRRLLGQERIWAGDAAGRCRVEHGCI